MTKQYKKIVFILGDELAINFVDEIDDNYLEIESVRYHRYLPELTDCTFYDWCIASESAVTALEIHLELSDFGSEVATRMQRLTYVSTDPFPRIHFQKESGSPLGLEAFGDLMFFYDNQETLAIVVSTEWISDACMQSFSGLTKNNP